MVFIKLARRYSVLSALRTLDFRSIPFCVQREERAERLHPNSKLQQGTGALVGGCPVTNNEGDRIQGHEKRETGERESNDT